MLKKMGMVLMAASFVTMASVVFAQMKDGLWEITTQVQIKGVPQQMPPATFRQCLDKNDPVPKNQDKNFDCKTISRKVSGNAVSYTTECKSKEGVMHTTGQNTYTGGTMNGTATSRFKLKGQPELQMTSSMKGTYLGACQK